MASKSDPVIGGFTTASIVTNQKSGDNFITQQVSRLGMPLVNEVVIGLPDSDFPAATRESRPGMCVNIRRVPTRLLPSPRDLVGAAIHQVRGGAHASRA